jgi:glutathione S-transferase
MELILHNHDASIFSEKVRRILAYKNLDWVNIQISPVPPKTNFVPLTGGYRRMPVLQIGADVYCDSALIIRKLEEIAPTPSVFPEGTSGIASMIADWADHRAFKWILLSAYPDFLEHMPDVFVKDRAALIPELDPVRVKALSPHAFEQFKQFVHFVNQSLIDHDFIAGNQFSVADAACFHLFSFARQSPRVFAPVGACPRILEWMRKIADFPAPKIRPEPDTYPLEVAKANEPQDKGDFTEGPDAFGLGDVVSISADDYAPERVKGQIVKLAPNHIAVLQVTKQLGEVAIHFPRLGFNIEAA